MKMEKEVMDVKASYKVLDTIKGVLVKVPGAGDQHLRWIEEHEIKTANGRHTVKEHYRRGDVFSGQFITRRFFVGPELIGETVVATVKVIEKTDYHKRGVKSLTLEIHPTPEAFPLFKLKVGASSGEYPIPGVEGKFISFESR